MSQHLRRAKQYQAAIRDLLMREWDPIGVAGIPEAADEYDSYIHQIYGMLIRREPKRQLFDFLWWAETENMGLFGSRRRTETVVDKLMRLPDELDAEQQLRPNDAG